MVGASRAHDPPVDDLAVLVNRWLVAVVAPADAAGIGGFTYREAAPTGRRPRWHHHAVRAIHETRSAQTPMPSCKPGRMLPLGKEATMTLTRKDFGATVLAALVVLVYVANVQDWWYLGSNRWAAVTMLAIGAISCPLGARIDEIEKGVTTPIILLGVLGITALVLGIIAIFTAAQWALLALAIVLIVLWAGTTLRHAATPPRPVAAH
jgi:hypothetical protein